jgi:hypothetical protein
MHFFFHAAPPDSFSPLGKRLYNLVSYFARILVLPLVISQTMVYARLAGILYQSVPGLYFELLHQLAVARPTLIFV